MLTESSKVHSSFFFSMTPTEKPLLVAKTRIPPKRNCHRSADKGVYKISTTSTKNAHHKLSELQHYPDGAVTWNSTRDACTSGTTVYHTSSVNHFSFQSGHLLQILKQEGGKLLYYTSLYIPKFKFSKTSLYHIRLLFYLIFPCTVSLGSTHVQKLICK